MPELLPKDLSQKIKKTADPSLLSGCYLFCGEEEYLKTRAAEALRAALFPDPAMLPFGRVKLSGEGKTAEELLSRLRDELTALPMFGYVKLIEVHSLSYNKLSERDCDTLFQLLSTGETGSSSLEGTVVLLYALPSELDPGTPPKRPSALWKRFCASPAMTVNFQRETPARLAVWVQKHFAASGILCDQSAARALIDYSSADMFALAGECEKLACYLLARGKNRVSAEEIPLVCRARYLDGSFAFTNAILSGKTEDSMRLLSDRRKKEKPEVILGGIADCICGMYNCLTLFSAGMQKREIAEATGLHEYRVGLFLDAARSYHPAVLRKALLACEKTDLRLKSSGGDRFLPLELLILRLAGAASAGGRARS